MTRTLSPLDDAPVWKCTTIAAWPVGLTAASTRSCAIPSFAKHPMVETDGHGESSRAFAMQRARSRPACCGQCRVHRATVEMRRATTGNDAGQWSLCCDADQVSPENTVRLAGCVLGMAKQAAMLLLRGASPRRSTHRQRWLWCVCVMLKKTGEPTNWRYPTKRWNWRPRPFGHGAAGAPWGSEIWGRENSATCSTSPLDPVLSQTTMERLNKAPPATALTLHRPLTIAAVTQWPTAKRATGRHLQQAEIKAASQS